MLDKAQIEQLIAEIYSRLNMTDDECDYEIQVPSAPALRLGITGGAKQSGFTLVPVAYSQSMVRREGRATVFRHTGGATYNVAGKTYPRINVKTCEEGLDLAAWLRSDPWADLQV